MSLATDGEERGRQFHAAVAARSRARRALWRWHDRREERFASRIPALPDSQLPAIRAAYEALAPESRAVLDVGGGRGRWRRLLGRPADYTIVDIVSPHDLHVDPNTTYVRADASALPFADAVFGLVLMVEVLHHLPRPAQALAEARRVLAPGGALVLTTRQAWPTIGAPYDYFRFTRYGLDQLLRRAGFHRRRLVALGGPASVVAVSLECNVPLLTKPLVKQLVGHPGWRLAALLDRTVFADRLVGPAPEVSGWLAIAASSESDAP